LDNFAKLSVEILKDENVHVLVFLGPEEQDLLGEVNAKFSSRVTILPKLNLGELFSISSFLSVLVSNDTGPMHLGAIAGASIILILDERGSLEYSPLTDEITIINSGIIDEIKVADVYAAVIERLKNDS
jgi:ADP-heptose:LPS heptosyltransferase